MGLLSSKENSILSRSNLKENGGKYSGFFKKIAKNKNFNIQEGLKIICVRGKAHI